MSGSDHFHFHFILLVSWTRHVQATPLGRSLPSALLLDTWTQEWTEAHANQGISKGNRANSSKQGELPLMLAITSAQGDTNTANGERRARGRQSGKYKFGCANRFSRRDQTRCGRDNRLLKTSRCKAVYSRDGEKCRLRERTATLFAGFHDRQVDGLFS
jgi:hypothetical protein